jgi:hypothetical protein
VGQAAAEYHLLHCFTYQRLNGFALAAKPHQYGALLPGKTDRLCGFASDAGISVATTSMMVNPSDALDKDSWRFVSVMLRFNVVRNSS